MKAYYNKKEERYLPVILELEPHEAAALKIIVGSVTGGGPVRKVSDTIFYELACLGYVNEGASGVEGNMKLSGSIPRNYKHLFKEPSDDKWTK